MCFAFLVGAIAGTKRGIMIRSESSYLNATINLVRINSRRHDHTDARLIVEELAAIALNTDKPRLRTKAMRALNEASTARNPGARFAALNFLDPDFAAATLESAAATTVEA